MRIFLGIAIFSHQSSQCAAVNPADFTKLVPEEYHAIVEDFINNQSQNKRPNLMLWETLNPKKSWITIWHALGQARQFDTNSHPAAVKGYVLFNHDNLTGERNVRMLDRTPLRIKNAHDAFHRSGKTDLLKKVAEHYKIHLMPKNENIVEVVDTLLNATTQDPAYGPLIQNFKISYNLPHEAGNNFPVIVIYPAAGKEKTQELLNRLYELFKDTEGSNIQPRFNEKITSLIWVAQGDADDKEGNYLAYFEDPPIYFNPAKMGEPDANYHLENPALADNTLEAAGKENLGNIEKSDQLRKLRELQLNKRPLSRQERNEMLKRLSRMTMDKKR